MQTNNAKIKEALRVISTIPSLKYENAVASSVMIRAKNNSLDIERTNLTQSIRVSIPCTGDIEFAAMWKQFYPAVKELTGETITIETTSNDIIIKDGRTTYECPIIPHENFPDFLPSIEGEAYTMPKKILAKAMSIAASCAKAEISRYCLSGVNVDENGFSGTDGRRLAIVKTPSPWKALIPFEMTKTINLLPDGDVNITVSQRRIQFECNGVRIATTVLEPNFPPYQSLLTTASTASFKLSAGNLLRAARQALISSNDMPVIVFNCLEDMFIAETPDMDGMVCFTTKIPASTTGHFEGRYNATYLYGYLDTLTKHISPDTEITVSQPKNSGPLTILTGEIQYILMPLANPPVAQEQS